MIQTRVESVALMQIGCGEGIVCARVVLLLLASVVCGCGGSPRVEPAVGAGIQEREKNARPGEILDLREGASGAARTAGKQGAGELPENLFGIEIVDSSGSPFEWESVKGSYSVLVTGSLSCFMFTRQMWELEALQEKYRRRGVKFYLVYTKEAHPSEKMWTQATSLEDRVGRTCEAAKNFSEVGIPWLVDNMKGELQEAMGGGPTADAILNKEGKMILRHDWLAPGDLSAELDNVLSQGEEGEIDLKKSL